MQNTPPIINADFHKQSDGFAVSTQQMSKDEIVQHEDEYGFIDYKNVARIRLGKYELDTWYGNAALFKEPVLNRTTNTLKTALSYKDQSSNVEIDAPSFKKGVLPSEINSLTHNKSTVYNNKSAWIDVLYVCPHCFKFTDIEIEWIQHTNCCKFRTKFPGKIMYSDGEVVIRKVRGIHHKLFCQSMCLMAKFYLDNKSIFYYLDYFDFYVIYQKLDRHEIPMGFYSRELLSWEMNNLSCICVFPCYQKRYLGTKLIEFSYKLSQYEQQISGPERPLSPLGKITYLKYWCRQISIQLVYGSLSTKSNVTLEILSKTTGFKIDDILLALSYMHAIYDNNKKNPNMDYYLDRYRNRDHYVRLDDGNYRVLIDKSKIKEWIIKNKITNTEILDQACYVLY